MPAHDVERACERVAPEQRALRPAQHFDVVDIEQVEVRAEQHRVIDIVDVEGDRRLAGEPGIARADAADERRHARTERALHAAELGIRHDGREIAHIGDAAFPQRFGGDGSDGDRGRLQIGGHACGGDDDVRDAIPVLAGRILGLRLNGGRQHHERRC
jgi:hypothetical protein